MNHEQLISLFLCLGIMLLSGRLLGEFFRKLRMPLVVGELLAGIMLGPTVLGHYYPNVTETIFTTQGTIGLVLSGITSISVVMLLFAAGMEVELSIIRQQGKTALKASFVGLVIPLVLGFAAGHEFYRFFGENNADNILVFSLFMGTAMAISALPIIARTLMDLNLFKTKVGMIIIAAAMLDDLIGWILFSVVLGMMNNTQSWGFLYTLAFTILFALAILTLGRFVINKFLPWAKRKLSWPGGILAISLGFAFLGAAFTERIGIHAIFGAFIVGIAFGDSVHLNEKTRDIINQFITNIFAPLFFVSIGFKINFVVNFNLAITLWVLLLAISSKLIGAGLGALWGGLSWRESLAVGFGMNARGAMEIVLGLLALDARVISEQLFVAIVVMAVLTSVMAGPMLQYLLTGALKVKVNLKELNPLNVND